MCGIIGVVSDKNIVPFLLKGLQQLEYRGYDSCGLAIHTALTESANGAQLQRLRSVQRVADLARQASDPQRGLQGSTGIAHTRWATHGAPSMHNAHPHFSHGPNADLNTPARVAVVHNGIIENHQALRQSLTERGYRFKSQTDTEVIAHLLDATHQGDPLQAVRRTLALLKGAYALAILFQNEPDRIIAACNGSPLVLGFHQADVFLASDPLALADATDQVVYLQDGDVVDIQHGACAITDTEGCPVLRPVQTIKTGHQIRVLAPHEHHMHLEIHEQADRLRDTLDRLPSLTPSVFENRVLDQNRASAKCGFEDIDRILLLGCGTSHHSACVAKFWLEGIARIPTQVEVASEYRYRDSVPDPHTLVVAVSQSGETADTLAALRHAQSLGMHHTLALCNVASSAMVRECALAWITHAGTEVGVASTKAFITQMLGFHLLALCLAQAKSRLSPDAVQTCMRALRQLPEWIEEVLTLEPQIQAWAQQIAGHDSAMFLGRGVYHPIAQEGALKLKEISYIHAEAFAAGELKHGPLALVTPRMPVIALVPNDKLLPKMLSNLQEVRARGGNVLALVDGDVPPNAVPAKHQIRLPVNQGYLSIWLHTVALQLLAYHTACARGTDVDKPRNLAKSVTVE